MEGIDDVRNITGIAGIINRKHTDGSKDLEQIEKGFTGGMMRAMPEPDPAREYQETLRMLQTDMAPAAAHGGRPPVDIGPLSLDDDAFLEEAAVPDSEMLEEYVEEPSAALLPPMQYAPAPRPSYQAPRPVYQAPPQPMYQAPPQPPMQAYYPPQPYGLQPSQGTDPLDDAMMAYSGVPGATNAAMEDEEDSKDALLEDIDALRSELEGDGVDVSRIKIPTKDDSAAEIKSIYNILRRKYDRSRCNGFGNEVIMAGAKMTEWFLDGTRQIGPFRPNLTGWSNTVRPKLRRMRYETSKIVSDIMQEYNLGPKTRLVLELLPSAVLYSADMSNSRPAQQDYTAGQMSSALDDLRQFD